MIYTFFSAYLAAHLKKIYYQNGVKAVKYKLTLQKAQESYLAYVVKKFKI